MICISQYHTISSQCSNFPACIINVQYMHVCDCMSTQFLQIKVKIGFIHCNYCYISFRFL